MLLWSNVRFSSEVAANIRSAIRRLLIHSISFFTCLFLIEDTNDCLCMVKVGRGLGSGRHRFHLGLESIRFYYRGQRSAFTVHRHLEMRPLVNFSCWLIESFHHV
jgi:hypothetical protein